MRHNGTVKNLFSQTFMVIFLLFIVICVLLVEIKGSRTG